MSEADEVPSTGDPKDKSLLWLVVEGATRLWANWCSPLSVPWLSTAKGNPKYSVEPNVYLSIRDAWYVLVLVLAIYLCFGTPSLIHASQSAWPAWLLCALAVHQIVDFVVLMVRLSLFGNHDKYEPLDWQKVPRIRKERTMLVLVLCYLCTLMWFAVLYRAIMLIDPAAIRVTPEFAAMSDGTRALALSIAGQTTVVYGAVAPLSLPAVLISGTQTIIGLFYVALAVASVLTVMNSFEKK